MEFSKEGYWSGLPFPSPGDLPDPRIKSTSLALPQILYQGSPLGDSGAHYSCASDSLVGKEPACNVGDPVLIPGLGRSLGEGKGYPLQYSDQSPWGPKEMDATELLSLLQLESH